MIIRGVWSLPLITKGAIVKIICYWCQNLSKCDRRLHITLPSLEEVEHIWEGKSPKTKLY